MRKITITNKDDVAAAEADLAATSFECAVACIWNEFVGLFLRHMEPKKHVVVGRGWKEPTTKLEEHPSPPSLLHPEERHRALPYHQIRRQMEKKAPFQRRVLHA